MMTLPILEFCCNWRLIQTNLDVPSRIVHIVSVCESSATEPGVVDEESHLPGPLVLLSLETSDNSVLGWGTLNTALSGEVVRASLVGGLALLVGPDGPGQSDELVLHRAGLGLHQSVSGGVLAEVPGGGWPPVLLRPQDTAVRQGQSGATEQNCCQENFHLEIQDLNPM